MTMPFKAFVWVPISVPREGSSSLEPDWSFIIRVVPDTDLAGYPANNFAGYLAWPDTGYPAG